MGNIKDKQKAKANFHSNLIECVNRFNDAVSTAQGDWIVKGFIDVAKNIYTISVDTKVVSKIMELVLFPHLCEFADKNKYKMILCREQNFYPDITCVDSTGNKFAVDFKSTYRTSKTEVNGMTLGAFTGYFRDRSSNKNVTFPYKDYVGHFVLGVIYSRVDGKLDERKIYQLTDLQDIPSVIRDFKFFANEKYQLAIDRPGSGNTKNIGSITNIDDLIQGNGSFAKLSEEVFDDYWMFYLTKDMARAVDLKVPPYRNLSEYKKYKELAK